MVGKREKFVATRLFSDINICWTSFALWWRPYTAEKSCYHVFDILRLLLESLSGQIKVSDDILYRIDILGIGGVDFRLSRQACLMFLRAS